MINFFNDIYTFYEIFCMNSCQPLVNGRGAKKQRPMTDSALAYLTTVKDAFKDDREKYDKFLELVKNFTAERFDHDVAM